MCELRSTEEFAQPSLMNCNIFGCFPPHQIYVPSPQTTPYNTITKQQSSGGGAGGGGGDQARANIIRQWQNQQEQGEQLAGPHRYVWNVPSTK